MLTAYVFSMVLGGGVTVSHVSVLDTSASLTLLSATPIFGGFPIDGLYLGAEVNMSILFSPSPNVVGLRVMAVPAYYLALGDDTSSNFYVRGKIGMLSDLSSDVAFGGGAGVGLAFAVGGDEGAVIQLGNDFLFFDTHGLVVFQSVTELSVAAYF